MPPTRIAARVPTARPPSGRRGQRLIAAATDGMNPISLRRDGTYHDRATLGVLPEDVFRLEQITAPTLVVDAKDDGLQPYRHGQNTAARVPGAQLVPYERGGHLLSLQIDDAREKVTTFVARLTAGPASNPRGVAEAVR